MMNKVVAADVLLSLGVQGWKRELTYTSRGLEQPVASS